MTGACPTEPTASRTAVSPLRSNRIEPVRALLLIEVEPLAVVAAHALALDDLRPADRAPLAGLLADLAGVALGPALDPEHRRQLRDQCRASRRPDRGSGSRDCGRRRSRRAAPRGRSTCRPSRTGRTSRTARRSGSAGDVLRAPGSRPARRPSTPYLIQVGVLLDAHRDLDPHPARDDRIHQLRQRAERADPAAVHAVPTAPSRRRRTA